MRRVAVGVATMAGALSLAVSGCTSGSSGPTGPTSVGVSGPSSWTLAGQVVPTHGPVMAGVSVEYTGHQAHTDAAGRFSVTHQVASTSSLTLSHPGLLERRVWLNGAQSRAVTLDPIALAAPFRLEFYSQLVRNTFEGTGEPQRLRRWTVPPKFYVRTTEDNGAAIDSDTLARVREGLTAGVQHYSPYSAPGIEFGAEDRAESSGWIIVRLHRRWQSGDPCGRATVGGDQGWISLYLDACRCSGERSRMAIGTVMHEVGHSMGFWHVSERPHILSVPYACGRFATADEKFHALIAYSRPVGNTDPDHDPSSGAFSLAEAGPAPVVSCMP